MESDLLLGQAPPFTAIKAKKVEIGILLRPVSVVYNFCTAPLVINFAANDGAQDNSK